jgi:hypothetical protein
VPAGNIVAECERRTGFVPNAFLFFSCEHLGHHNKVSRV